MASDNRVKETIVDSRINKILSMRTDSTAMIEAFDSISSFYVDNTLEARRSLRQDLELQNITLAKEFLTEYAVIYDQIENIENTAITLHKSCIEMTSKMSNASENMKIFMKKAFELNNIRDNYLNQSKQISLFLNKYQLSAEEVTILYTTSLDNTHNDNSQSFFNALKRLQIAYIDCKTMVEMNNYTGNTTGSTGFELLDLLGKHILYICIHYCMYIKIYYILVYTTHILMYTTHI